MPTLISRIVQPIKTKRTKWLADLAARGLNRELHDIAASGGGVNKRERLAIQKALAKKQGRSHV